MAGTLFGTDGVRGEYNARAGMEYINPKTGAAQVGPEMFEAFGAAHALHLWDVHDGTRPEIVVGSDTRSSSPVLREACIQGAVAAGAQVIDMGVAPTPVIAWTAQQEGVAGIAITASHNPDKDNGFKPLGVGGNKLAGTEITDVERHFESIKQDGMPRLPGGDVRSDSEGAYADEYIDYLTSQFGHDALRDRIVVVDGANGAGYEIAPRLYRALGAEVITVACDVSRPINDRCGAAHLDGAAQSFLSANPDIAQDPRFLGLIAHDGDADRVMGLDSRGREITGNHWMYQLGLGEFGIAGTQYTNSATRLALQAAGVEFHECGNGDSYVTAKLRELNEGSGWQKYRRGGEFSGHLIDLEHLSSGDGMFMGAWLLQRLVQDGGTLTDTYDSLPLWDETMHGITLSPGVNGKGIVASSVVQDTVAGIQQQHGDGVRLVVRASGTEPKIRVWAESQSTGLSGAVVQQLSSAIQQQARAAA